MKIAVQTGGVEERLGLDGAYRLIREAGFDGMAAFDAYQYDYEAVAEDSVKYFKSIF